MRGIWKALVVAAMAVALAGWMSPGPTLAAEKVYEFKISVDTVPNHPRNMGLVIFIEELQKRSGESWFPSITTVPSSTRMPT